MDNLVPAAHTATRDEAEKNKARARTGSNKQNFHQHNLVGYLFISPWLTAFFLFSLVPILISLYLAFTNYDLLSGGEFTGLANFQRMFFEDIRYGRSVR